MNKAELEKGKKLASQALAWWRGSVPGYEQDAYSGEPVPVFVKWFNAHAAPALAELNRKQEENDELVKIRSQARRKK